MSDRVNQLIEDIRGKVDLMKGKVTAEQNKNSELSQEIESLKAKLQSKENEVLQLNGKIQDLETEKNDLESKNIAVPAENGVSEEQIDELVKEIEYCITQLKK